MQPLRTVPQGKAVLGEDFSMALSGGADADENNLFDRGWKESIAWTGSGAVTRLAKPCSRRSFTANRALRRHAQPGGAVSVYSTWWAPRLNPLG